jgi:hypothetical protein
MKDKKKSASADKKSMEKSGRKSDQKGAPAKAGTKKSDNTRTQQTNAAEGGTKKTGIPEAKKQPKTSEKTAPRGELNEMEEVTGQEETTIETEGTSSKEEENYIAGNDEAKTEPMDKGGGGRNKNDDTTDRGSTGREG